MLVWNLSLFLYCTFSGVIRCKWRGRGGEGALMNESAVWVTFSRVSQVGSRPLLALINVLQSYVTLYHRTCVLTQQKWLSPQVSRSKEQESTDFLEEPSSDHARPLGIVRQIVLRGLWIWNSVESLEFYFTNNITQYT